MKIAKYGLDNFLFLIALGLVFFALTWIFNPLYLKIFFSILGIFVFVVAFWFFRDPERNIPLLALEDESILVSPADGSIVEIKEIFEQRALNSSAIQISIFLSPTDVHVNRSPISGKVIQCEYHPGKFLVAYNPKASEENEHTFIIVENVFGKVVFKQIAGVLARRVVCSLKVGDSVIVGQKIGMMKFGSRMDVIIPKASRIFVQLNQKVVAGETIIAQLPKDAVWNNFPLDLNND